MEWSPTSPSQDVQVDHPVANNLLSPSVTDSAIDMDSQDTARETSDLPAKTTHNTPSLRERFVTLADLISNPSTQSHLLQFDSCSTTTIHQHLDQIERVLDPRRGISLEIAKQRPRSRSGSRSRPKTLLAPVSSSQTDKSNTPPTSGPMQPSATAAEDQMSGLFNNLKSVTEQLQHRRQETQHLNALFTMKCEAMAQRIIALENEVHELESDILEDTIELEGLRGTVRGLESWIGRWKRQRESTQDAPTNKSTASTKGKKKKKRKGAEDASDEYDNDALIDGIDAWMRGWKDAEEGSRVRARMRKQRRELRRRRKVEARQSNG